MANPLEAFGFMPMNQALGMNWEQSRPAMGPIEAMAGMPDFYRQAAQQQYSHQPMADSFLRRFGQPMVEQQQQSPMQPDMLQALMAQGGMIDALTNADARGAGTSFDQSARGGEGEVYYGGDLANQPWLQQFAEAGRQGVDLPMLHGNAGPQSEAMKAGIAERRQQRLGEQVPMKDRQASVRQKALIKSEQRAGRMGDISPNEMYFNQAGRFAGGMGEGGEDFLNGVFFGGQTAAEMQGNRLKAQEAQTTREWAGSPTGIRAAQAAGGLPISSLYGLQQEQEDPQGTYMRNLLAASPTFDVFAMQIGNRDIAKQAWIAAGRPDPDGPGFWGSLYGGGQSSPPMSAPTIQPKSAVDLKTDFGPY
jgi:hypothetical protein